MRPVNGPTGHQRPVRLPVDPRGGAFEYEKRFVVPDEWGDKTVLLRFEGGCIAMRSCFVNGGFVTHRRYGYSELTVRMDEVLEVGPRTS